MKTDETRFQFVFWDDNVQSKWEERRGVSEAERHSYVLICIRVSDKRCFGSIFLSNAHLPVAGVCVKRGKDSSLVKRENITVHTRQREAIVECHLVELTVINRKK